MKAKWIAAVLVLTLAGCKDSPVQPPPSGNEYRVGELVRFNVNLSQACSNPDHRWGRVVAISQRAIVVADTANPGGPGTFSDADYEGFAHTFDQEVWPVVTSNFGVPHDVDGNGRIIIFFTRAVNELTPENQSWFVGGAFFARDLFPRSRTTGFDECAASNYAEMFYMLVPDPQGVVNNNRRLIDRELRSTVAVLAHEFQHLINASRRLYVVGARGDAWNEDVWLNEGLSHIAEELMMYGTSSLSPGENIDGERLLQGNSQEAFFRFQSSNMTRLAAYLENPDTASLIGPDGLATRGAAWLFLRYAADRRGGAQSAFWRAMIDTQSTGLQNVRSAIGAEPMDWVRDWSVALYAADLVPGLASPFTLPSWNLRSIYPRLIDSQGRPVYGAYPLRTRTLSSGQEQQLSIRAGSAAYLEFAVRPGATGQLWLGDSSAGCEAVSLSVGQVLTFAAGPPVCVDGGASGGDFVYVPFLASSAGGEHLQLRVRSSGVTAPMAAASSMLAASRSLGAAMPPRRNETSGDRGSADPAYEWKLRLRERESRELAPLVGGGGAAALRSRASMQPSVQTVAADDPRLRISIVRIR